LYNKLIGCAIAFTDFVFENEFSFFILMLEKMNDSSYIW